MYRHMHVHGDPSTAQPGSRTFDGRSLKPQVARIRRLIERTGARRLLDYGCGKGTQYDLPVFEIEGVGRWDGLLDYWGVDEVHCYDPAYAPHSRLPEDQFDGVICTDVLEHCPEEDVDWIIGEMFGYATQFVFATIACYPAMKRLPNGDNAHCTVREPEWWQERFAPQAAAHPGVQWEIWLQKPSSVPGKRTEDVRIASWSS